jgi:dTDP-4-amino-4,6-dideoxygalactose transaminase
MGVRFGGAAGQCPVTEAVADELVRLPLYFQLSDAEQGAVVAAITSFTP